MKHNILQAGFHSVTPTTYFGTKMHKADKLDTCDNINSVLKNVIIDMSSNQTTMIEIQCTKQTNH